MQRRTCGVAVLLAAIFVGSAAAAGGIGSITAAQLREWLSYLASDQLEGRATYGSGIGIAAGYLEAHLRAIGARPAGDAGSYLQTVRVRGVRSRSRSSVTVQVGRETRTFKDREGVRFPSNAGGPRSLTIDRVEFAGYGLDVPAENHSDYRGRDVRGAVAVWLGSAGPKALDEQRYRRLLSGRSRHAVEQLGAAATIGPEATPNRPDADPAPRAAAANAPDFTTAQRLDAPIAPAVTANDDVLEFLFSAAPVSYADLKRKAADREPLPGFRLEQVKITFTIDHEYEIVRTQHTQNVVGIVEGTDPALKDTYVAFGAHYDHVGYAESEVAAGQARRPGAPGRVTAGALDDRIWNGADDDGSGTVALMAIAKAFAEGPRPKRSLLFVWHSGEERGLLGSRYYADHPTVPIAAIVAQLNVDMIGRNRDDRASEADTVYLVGSDRISTELHEINRAANRALPRPLALNYEMNDPSDLEQIYTRSDHYSYAAKGIPIIFFTTGLHPDYHANTDEVDKIEFDKLTRITQLIYETGARVANLDHPPVRDNKGPRAGRDTR